jgi:hypothetical protein
MPFPCRIQEIPRCARNDRVFLVIGGREAGAFRINYTLLCQLFFETPLLPSLNPQKPTCHPESASRRMRDLILLCINLLKYVVNGIAKRGIPGTPDH